MMGESKGKAKNFRVGRSSVVFWPNRNPCLSMPSIRGLLVCLIISSDGELLIFSIFLKQSFKKKKKRLTFRKVFLKIELRCVSFIF